MATILRSPLYFRTERKRSVGVVTAQNLLLSTLAAVVVAAPFKPAEQPPLPRKPAIYGVTDQQGNLLHHLLAPPRQISAEPEHLVQRQRAVAVLEVPNLLPRILAPLYKAPPDFGSAQLARKALWSDTTQGVFPSRIPVVVAEPPFAPDWFEPVLRRFAPPADTSLSWRYIPARAEPFFTQEWQPTPKRPASYPHFDIGGVAKPDEVAPTAPFTPPAFDRFQARLAVAAQGEVIPLFYLPPPTPPVANLPFFTQLRKPVASDWTPAAKLLFFPEVFPPFAPVDAQRPQAKRPVTFELPPNLQSLFASTPPVPPFRPYAPFSPIEWAIHYQGLGPDVFQIPTAASPPIPGTPSNRGLGVPARPHIILVEARPHTITASARGHTILVESDGTL